MTLYYKNGIKCMMSRGPDDWQEPTDEVPLLRTPVLYIGDVHGDAMALERTFDQAGWADKRHSKMVKIRKEKLPGTIVLLGDLIDRWRQNIQVLETVLQLQDQMGERCITLLGNHELMMIEALRNQNPTMIEDWLDNGGDETLAELTMHGRLMKQALDHAEPLSDQAMEYFNKTYESPEVASGFIDAFIASRQLFLKGRYASLFNGMKISHSAGGVLAVHAGIDSYTGTVMEDEGLDVVNRGYNTAWQMNALKNWVYPTGFSSTLWRRKGIASGNEALDAHTAKLFREKGIHVLIHGHDYVKEGIQKWRPSHRILEVNADCSMSRGMPSENQSGSVEILPNGIAIARNGVYGERQIGRMEKDRFKLFGH